MAKTKTWKIYVHQNLTNGKLYIGQTSEENVKRRWRGGSNYIDSVYFYNAIKKYSWDGFRHFVLIEDIQTQEEANLIEEFLIKKYNTTNADYGYNLQSGGGNRLQSEETKKKLSEIKLKAHQEKEEVKRVKQEFEQKKDLISLKQIEPVKAHSGGRKAVICIETQQVYPSSVAASKATNVPARAIRAVCLREQKTTRNLHWDYYKEGVVYKLEDYQNIKSNTNRKAKKVKCIELDIVFNSASEASRYFGMAAANNILDCCRKIKPTCHGFHWEFEEKGEI